MKAAVITDKYELDIKDLPVPEIGQNQVLIRNKACAICNTTDIKLYKGMSDQCKYPFIIGHEGAGIVEKIGYNVANVKPGDCVLSGGYPATAGMNSIWGQLCEYGVEEAKNLIFIPSGTSLEHAACAHMLAETLNAIGIGEVKPGENILIIGAGAVGISLLTLLKHSFSRKVIMLDILQEKRDYAMAFGADAVFDPGDPELFNKINDVAGLQGISLIYEAVGRQETYNLAFDLIARRGRIVGFGVLENTLEVPFKKMMRKEAQVRWSLAGGTDPRGNRQIVLNMINKNLIDVNKLITSRIKLDNINEGFKRVMKGKEIRVIVEI